MTQPFLHKRTLALIVTCLIVMAPAWAEQGPEEDKSYVDGIFDLENLGPLEIDEHRNRLVLSIGSEILEVSVFPVETISRKEIDFVPEIIRATNDYVFTLGYTEQEITLSDGKNQSARGQIFRGLGVSPKSDDDIEYQFLTFDRTIGAGSKNRLEQATILEIDNHNRSYISGVTSNEINIIEFGKLSQEERVRHPFLITRCGAPNQLSIGDPGGDEDPFYVVSISGEPTIEIGSLSVHDDGKAKAECVSREATEGTANTSFSSLNHALIQNPQTKNYSLITLDLSARDLSSTPIHSFFGDVFLETYQAFNAEAEIVFPANENGSDFGILASSGDGSVILISGVGQNRVHRFRQLDRSFEYLGFWTTERPIRTVQIGKNARLAAIVTGDGFPGYLEEITIIRDLEEIPANWPLPKKRYSIRALQEELNSQGEVVTIDGQLGPETRAAIGKVIGDVALPTATAATKKTVKRPTRAIPTAKPASSVSRAVKGAFPMGVFR